MDYAVSIVIPIYNAEKWLKRCIDRIILQPFHHFDLLLIDDGSTDGSRVLCEEAAAKDNRIKILQQSNCGASTAKNIGLRAASGKYIAFLDADDVIDELFLVTLFHTAEEHACDIVVSGYQTVPNNIVISPHFKHHTLLNGRDFILSSPSVHSDNDLCFTWRSLFLREKLVSGGIQFHEELFIGEDTIFQLEALLKSERVFAIPDPLYYYTVNNADSLMSSFYKPALEKSLLLQYELRKELSTHFGLLDDPYYRRDMAEYYINAIYGMLVRNAKNSPSRMSKSEWAKLIHYEMFTESTKEIGFFYKCSSMKEYFYYLAMKFKLSSLLYYWEFRSTPSSYAARSDPQKESIT